MPKAIPDGYHSVTPYLSMRDANTAIDFYQRALGAVELYRLTMPNGKVGHAELQIGGSRIMLADENAEWGSLSALTLGGTAIALCLYTDNVDALAARFLGAGGSEVMPLQNKFYGDRSGEYKDPEGYRWTLMQHIEDVTPDQMRERMAKLFNEGNS